MLSLSDRKAIAQPSLEPNVPTVPNLIVLSSGRKGFKSSFRKFYEFLFLPSSIYSRL